MTRPLWPVNKYVSRLWPLRQETRVAGQEGERFEVASPLRLIVGDKSRLHSNSRPPESLRLLPTTRIPSTSKSRSAISSGETLDRSEFGATIRHVSTLSCLLQHRRRSAVSGFGEDANSGHELHVDNPSRRHEHRNSYEQPHRHQLPRHMRVHILIRKRCETHAGTGEGCLLCRLEWSV